MSFIIVPCVVDTCHCFVRRFLMFCLECLTFSKKREKRAERREKREEREEREERRERREERAERREERGEKSPNAVSPVFQEKKHCLGSYAGVIYIYIYICCRKPRFPAIPCKTI